MKITFELNNKQKIFTPQGIIKLNLESFPIKVTLVDHKGRKTERIIYIRERKGESRINLS